MILKEYSTIDDPILYNYSVERAIRKETKFNIDEYIKKQTLTAFYLLIYPVLRFEKRDVIEKTIEEKTLA
jgi:hypothetical protein